MSNFIEKVVTRTQLAPDQIVAVLTDYGVREYVPAAPPAKLRIRQVRFSGFEHTKVTPPTEPFEFSWDLPSRVSALATRDNFAGKTSVIEMIRWLLSGRSEVDRWVFERIQHASLAFTVDGQEFVVEAERDAGSTTGRLKLRGEVIRTFDDRSFAGVMEDLLLPRLGLDRISTFQRYPNSDRGQITSAGWPLLIDALHVRPSELSTVIGGVAQRAGLLLQVYLALPWYETLLQARAAAAASRQTSADVVRTAQEEERIRGAETERIGGELAEARAQLVRMADEQAVADRLQDAMNRVSVLAESELRAAARVQAAESELAEAEQANLASRRVLRNLIEREAAGAFFRALDPKLCPRCSMPIDDQRREQETADHVCAVCTRPAAWQPDPTARSQTEAEVAATQEAVDSAKRVLDEMSAEHSAIAEQRIATEQEITRLAVNEALGRRREQEALISRLEGRLEEREETRRQLAEPAASSPGEEIRILEAAQAEADERVRQSGQLFDELNEEILQLGQRFGISGLTEVKLDRGAHLPVVKEGTRYNFGNLPAGDKLRLKVAVVIALMRIGRRHGTGRHPGLLFVDSPGAEEVTKVSLKEMITGLADTAEELDLQVVFATARFDEVSTTLNTEVIRSPYPGQTKLW